MRRTRRRVFPRTASRCVVIPWRFRFKEGRALREYYLINVYAYVLHLLSQYWLDIPNEFRWSR